MGCPAVRRKRQYCGRRQDSLERYDQPFECSGEHSKLGESSRGRRCGKHGELLPPQHLWRDVGLASQQLGGSQGAFRRRPLPALCLGCGGRNEQCWKPAGVTGNDPDLHSWNIKWTDRSNRNPGRVTRPLAWVESLGRVPFVICRSDPETSL